MSNVYWVGTRESDIQDAENIYKGSITIYGSNNNNNIAYSHESKKRVNHNCENLGVSIFFKEKINIIIENDKTARFMFYNPYNAYKYDEEIIKRTICLNELSLLNFLRDKIQSRLIFSNYVPVLESKVLLGNQCCINTLSFFFPKYKEFIIQSNNASGGAGTHILKKETENKVLNKLKKNEPYLVSPYYEISIPINIHAIVYENNISLFPGSIQLICEYNNKLLYMGADFITYKEITESIQQKIKKYSLQICKQLKNNGYLGVCGIDFLIVNNKVLFLEVNHRFQASTVLVNKALKGNNFPTLNELCINAFNSNYIKTDNKVEIPFSCYTFLNVENELIHANHILHSYKNEKSICKIDLDGYNKESIFEQDAYLFRLLFNSNISSISFDNKINLHENIKGFLLNFNIQELTDLFEIKIRLLNQGIQISEKAKKYLNKIGQIRKAVFDAIDITLTRNIKVNCPYNVKLASISPFTINYNTVNGLHLQYYNNFLFPIEVDLHDKHSDNLTKQGIPFHIISKLTTDRLRVHYQNVCFFKHNNKSCLFCNLPLKNIAFGIDDIFEVIDYYIAINNFRHFLIGGASNNPDNGWDKIIKIISYIKSKSDKPIYLMSLPPSDLLILDNLHKAGLNEIAFNIEIFNRNIAQKVMPQKGYIPLNQYYSAFEKAVELWGNKGNVRSVLLIGLDDYQSLINGINIISKIGVSPILSVFRPLNSTFFENYIPPNYEYLKNIYYTIQRICNLNNVLLGPQCTECQNNTLSFPYYFDDSLNS